MSKELETIALWRDGGGGLWMGWDRPERPWNWLTGTDASPDDLLSGESRKVEESFRRIDPDDVRPTPDLPDRDPRNVLTDTWRVVPDDRLVTFEPGGLPKSWRISAVRRNAADLSLVVNDPVTGEPVEPDLMALLRDGCFDFDRSRETPEWQGFWRSERGTVAYRDASGARPQMDAGYDETGPRQRTMHTEAVGRFIPIANCHIRVWLPLAGFGPNR